MARPILNMIPSKVESIATLRIYPLPAKPINVARAVRHESTIVVIGLDGRIYSSGVNSRTFWSNTNRLGNTVKALIKLGALSQAAVDEHKAAEAAASAKDERKWSAGSILDNLESAGLKLTAAQLAMLQKLKDAE